MFAVLKLNESGQDDILQQGGCTDSEREEDKSQMGRKERHSGGGGLEL